MKKIKNLILAIMVLLVASCTPQQQDVICPPSPLRLVGADVQNIKVIKHEDSGIHGNSDEPYIMNVGFRVTLGKTCSTVAQNMTPTPCWASVNWSSAENGIAVPIPYEMGSMWFDKCWNTNGGNLQTVLTEIQQDGFQIFGNVVIVLEQDNWPQSTRNQIQNALRDAIKAVLEESIETAGQIDQQNLNSKLLTAISQINLGTLRKIRLFLDAFGNDDDIIGVHMNLFLGMPDSWLDLTGITQNDFKAAVNVGEALTSAANINGTLGAIVNPIILSSQGKIDFRVRVSGVGFSLPGTAGDVNPVFNLYDQSNNLRATYELSLSKLVDCTGSSIPHPNLLLRKTTCL
jgi:hypothetical protein